MWERDQRYLRQITKTTGIQNTRECKINWKTPAVKFYSWVTIWGYLRYLSDCRILFEWRNFFFFLPLYRDLFLQKIQHNFIGKKIPLLSEIINIFLTLLKVKQTMLFVSFVGS